MTTVMDLAGVACLAVFGWFVWPPVALLVVGVALLAVSRKAAAE